MRSIIINKNDAGQRFDKFLHKYVKNAPTSLLYKYIRKKRIKVNGKKAAIDYFLQEGDTVDLYIKDELFDDDKKHGPSSKYDMDLTILYEDDNILLADKKPGMSVHADQTENENTLIYQIQKYLIEKGEYRPKEENSFAPSLCNRIDRNTGGIVIAAKNAPALRILNDKIKKKEIEKEYLCIAFGKFEPKKGEIVSYLEKDSRENKVYSHAEPTKGAKLSKSLYEVLEEKDELSLVKVRLITGRTHQIRAQFASIGHPLLGDGKYGTNAQNKPYKYRYQALYSYKITFNFSNDKNALSYLDRKTYEIREIDFLEDWKKGTLKK